MEKYNEYVKINNSFIEAKNWLHNKNKIDSQSGTHYSLCNINFKAEYAGQAYAGANNYHESPKLLNEYMAKVIKKRFLELTNDVINLMQTDVEKSLIECEKEMNEVQTKIFLAKSKLEQPTPAKEG